MSEQDLSRPEPTPAAPTHDTVEAVVRSQLSKALGGRRGMVEAAVPTIVFTALWLSTREMTLALSISVGAALVLLAVRLVQRSSVQFCLNALFGIGLGWFFVYLARRNGGDADEQALAYFLPGLLYNLVYAIGMGLSCVTRWPLVGFAVGSVTGDATGWHDDRQIVKLCTRLTWLLAVPCVLRVLVQGPIWLAARGGGLDADTAIAALGVLKIALGWPLQLAVLASMLWVLNRDQTPIEPSPDPAS